MAKVTLKGNAVTIAGELPALGERAPDFKLAGADLSDKGLADFKGKRKVLNIVASLDTSVCATSARKFNEAVSKLPDTVLLNISADLPYAASRFCASEGLEGVITLSTFRSPSFGKDYGVTILDGPMAGLMSRAVVVLDTDDKVLYTQQVPEISEEPDYDRALTAVTS